MMEIRKIESLDRLADLKHQYMQQTTAPLDGMWLCGFVPVAKHFGIFQGDRPVGYFCVNDEGYVLQFFVAPRRQDQSSALFESIFQQTESAWGELKGAFVSTAEPFTLSLCLDKFPSFEVNALMYQLDDLPRPPLPKDAVILTEVDSSRLETAIDFVMANVEAQIDWLTGYLTNLIQRRELFGVWHQGTLIATGETRAFDKQQKGYADLGVIVAKSERGNGLATQVLKRLVEMNEHKGLKSMCSTESSNIGAQKAITRAGFFAGHRILQFVA